MAGWTKEAVEELLSTQPELVGDALDGVLELNRDPETGSFISLRDLHPMTDIARKRRRFIWTSKQHTYMRNLLVEYWTATATWLDRMAAEEGVESDADSLAVEEGIEAAPPAPEPPKPADWGMF